MPRPNLNSLKMFDCAARHLNFRLAAEELNLTQGAVAQQVRRLESDLGTQLFHRKARGLALTELGQNYYSSISQALAIIDEATSELQPKTTEVTLSVTPSFASKWLVPRLAALSREHPEFEVHVLANSEMANFRSDGVDLAVRLGKPPFGKNLHCEHLVALDLCAVCSPDFAKEIAPIEQLKDFTSLQLLEDSFLNIWQELLSDAGLRPRQRMIRFSHTALALDAAANGQGITLAPRILLDLDFEQGRLVELWRDTRPDQGGFYIVYPRNRISYHASVLKDWIFAEVKNTKPE